MNGKIPFTRRAFLVCFSERQEYTTLSVVFDNDDDRHTSIKNRDTLV